MTTRIMPWIAASFVLTLSSVQAFRVQHARAEGARPAPFSSGETCTGAPEELRSFATEQPLTPERTASGSACEPLTPLPCEARGDECPDMSDGTPRVCRRPYKEPEGAYACYPNYSPPAVRRWREARLTELAASVGSSNDEDLALYLLVIAGRETSLRPWKRHRLRGDVDSASSSWKRRSDVFADSPAHDEPERWREGLGLYGQNPALWVDKWDASAEPEVLCGEVESTLVHLRAARRRWAQLDAGIVCDGEEFHGTGELGAPSWYDLSLVNSGSRRCPAQLGDGQPYAKRLDFEARCERAGLDPYAAVALSDLGEPVDFNEQEQFAASVYERLDAIER